MTGVIIPIQPYRPRSGFWAAQGACRGDDTESWFPQRGEHPVHAQAVCASCPVRLECLDYALGAREPYGIWGGLTVIERERILRRLRKAAG